MAKGVKIMLFKTPERVIKRFERTHKDKKVRFYYETKSTDIKELCQLLLPKFNYKSKADQTSLMKMMEFYKRTGYLVTKYYGYAILCYVPTNVIQQEMRKDYELYLQNKQKNI